MITGLIDHMLFLHISFRKKRKYFCRLSLTKLSVSFLKMDDDPECNRPSHDVFGIGILIK